MTQKRTEADRSDAARSSAKLEREKTEREATDDYYAPASRLTVPEHPDFIYRWIAEYVNGDYRAVGVQKQMQDGYVRVLMEDLPEDFMLYDPTEKRSESDHFTRYGGLILMRMPKARHAKRTAYYQKLSRERLESANELQGVAGRDSVKEDRGSRTITGEDAARTLTTMNQT